MASCKNFKERIEKRRKEGEVRQEERNARGDAGQLQRLEARGFGECREAQRLRKSAEE